MTKLIDKPVIETDAVPPVNVTQPLGGKELMSWTIKSFPLPMLAANITMSIVTLVPFGLFLYGYSVEDSFHMEMGVFGVCFWLLLWKGVGRKNLYHYRITDQGGEVTYWMDFPDGIITFFKSLSVIFLFIILCVIVIEPSFIWMLAGPAGIAIGGAKVLLSWKKEIRYSHFKWDRPDWIFIDRKRKLVVVTRRDNPDIPIEQNYLNFDAFLPKERLDEFISLTKQYAPETTDFEEGRWKY